MDGSLQQDALTRGREKLAEYDDEILCWDGFDDAIIGVGYRFSEGPVALYDKQKIIDILIDEGCTEEEAIEHFEFNIIGGWIGDKTPMVAELFTDV